MSSTSAAEMIRALQYGKWATYSQVSSLTLYVHHFGMYLVTVEEIHAYQAKVSTVPAEIDVVWQARRTPMKILYLINRYFGLIVIATQIGGDLNPRPSWAACECTTASQLALLIEISVVRRGLFPVDYSVIAYTDLCGGRANDHARVIAILQIRLHALYGRNRSLIVIVTALYIGQLLATFIVFLVKIALHKRASAESTGSICINSSNVTSGVQTFYWLGICFDFFVLALIIWKTMKHIMSRRRQGVPLEWGSGGLMFTVIARDSVLYYVINVAIWLANTLVWAVGSPGSAELVSLWSIVVPTVAMNSMVLNLSRSARPDKVFISSGSRYTGDFDDSAERDVIILPETIPLESNHA
ncbi:hypothetical protein OE88DRAFT_1736556 [Heliocybe sulcata]|uniref:DUF6533 domain-containing protein n=1 Tax=Heliocybe sulcata TaxID=5364 RepID=A0A5C3MXE8_9AGAM|nr:hypothetical protein OE88DRAFT_1736556 [Heliocybe sulcata]